MSIETVVRLEREIARLQALQAQVLADVASRSIRSNDGLALAMHCLSTSDLTVENRCGRCGFGSPDVTPLS